jgi:hypothetical protein
MSTKKPRSQQSTLEPGAPATGSGVLRAGSASVEGSGVALKKTTSREQLLIRRFAAKHYPDGTLDVPTRQIIKKVGDAIEASGRPVPRRDTFLRALGRRK